ncbi:MAG: hypothetical protein K6G42_06450 [Lachnospiraceae bacterium]|nr:hypothetical protein [Lachnospiraceae bacterium]
MKIIVGGKYNGKLRYVTEQLKIPMSDICDMASVDISAAIDKMGEYPVLYHLEAFIKASVLNGIDHNSILDKYITGHPDCILICDETGAGVIPTEPDENRWREETGNTLCRLAEKAGGITRIIYGTAEELKYGG